MTTSEEDVIQIIILRLENPEYSKYKLSLIAKRDCDTFVSASTVGRIIKYHNLFWPTKKTYRQPTKQSKSIKPKGLVANKPRDVFELDMKHLPSYMGNERFPFVVSDVACRRVHIKVSTTASSKQATIAIQEAIDKFGQLKSHNHRPRLGENLQTIRQISPRQSLNPLLC